MLRILGIVFGIVMIFVGVVAFFPSFNPNGLLFGYFEVNTMHNIVHIVTGVLAIMAATNDRYIRLFFQIFGIVYAIVAILGFARNGDLFMMHVNTADNLLHVGIAIISLYLGFMFKRV